MTKTETLSAKNVKKSIGDTRILNGINAQIFAGDFTVIMGASGSGKSTLLYALSGMDRATSGSVIYGDDDKVTKIVSPEFGWKSSDISLENSELESGYVFMDGRNISLKNVQMCNGKVKVRKCCKCA